MHKERKVILYISMSLDGYIAKTDDDLGFLSLVEEKGEDYGYGEFVKSTDAVIIGRKTYDKVVSMGFDYPHTDKDVYIITHTTKPNKGPFKYYNGSLTNLVANLKSRKGKNIYCDGGAQIANQMLKEELIDELIISIIPIMLGEGVKLFKDGRPELKLKLVHCKHYKKGLVQMHYSRNNN